MNVADFSIGIFIVTSSVIGLFQGFVKEVLSVLAWMLSLALALAFVKDLAQLLSLFIPFADLQIGIALTTLFFATFIMLLWVNYLIINSLGPTPLSGFERFLGGLFGLIRGGIAIIFLILLAALTQISTMPWWQEALLIQKFKLMAILLCSHLPADMITQFNF
ncbi:MAG: CvpA family protein [Pseudomonadota bacterium]|nr:CvpA family protein [Pseudomonadota bacterium]